MASRGEGQDDLQVLRALFRERGAVFRRGKGSVYVADPVLAKEILDNGDERYREHSDFFHTKSGIFGPRAAQVEIGRATRVLLREHLESQALLLPALIDRELAPVSHWPDAANHLAYAQFGAVLLGADTPAAVRDLVEQVIQRAVLTGARDRYSTLTRVVFRGKVMRVLIAEIETRRNRGGSVGVDILDAVVQAAPRDADPGQLAEVFLSCLFAVVGSVGFLVAWSVLLLGTGTAPVEADAQPAHIVREALRLWPVAWLFGRRPVVPHELGGVEVTPRDEVVVCNYLVQRDPGHWSEPDEFRPRRWADSGRNPAFLPFGWGPHACTGAAVALQFAEAVISVLMAGYRMEITRHRSTPHIAAALAPPPFTARLTPLPQ